MCQLHLQLILITRLRLHTPAFKNIITLIALTYIAYIISSKGITRHFKRFSNCKIIAKRKIHIKKFANSKKVPTFAVFKTSITAVTALQIKKMAI